MCLILIVWVWYHKKVNVYSNQFQQKPTCTIVYYTVVTVSFECKKSFQDCFAGEEETVSSNNIGHWLASGSTEVLGRGCIKSIYKDSLMVRSACRSWQQHTSGHLKIKFAHYSTPCFTLQYTHVLSNYIGLIIKTFYDTWSYRRAILKFI